MKKLLTLMIVMSLILSMTIMSVNAATASDAKAKFGAATIDGKISENEYGTEYKFTKDTSTPFEDNGIDPLPFDYYINWTEEGLFVAIKATLAEADWDKFMPQFNMNPWDVIPSGQKLQGLFFSFKFVANDKVTFMMHNHDTVGKAGAESDGGKTAILENIDYKIGTDGDATVVEFKLPVDLLKIKSDTSKIDASDKKLEANQSFGFAAFLIYQGKGWGQTTSPDYKDWDVEKIGLGKLTLEAETPAPTTEPSPDKTDKADDTTDKGGLGAGTIAAIVVGVILVAAIVIFFVTKKKG